MLRSLIETVCEGLRTSLHEIDEVWYDIGGPAWQAYGAKVFAK